MAPLTTSQPPDSESTALKPVEKTYTIGTLRYNQRQLVVLFFWLMWNDFSITLIERVGGLGGQLMRSTGATFTQMAVMGSIGGFLSPWINPWVSTWSDRLRSKHGRRRPFLFVATPFFALFLMAFPFMPDVYHSLLRFHWMQALSTHFPMNGEALFMGVCGIISGYFNAVVLAIFQYLYWDVVPGSLMGRFNALGKNVGLIAILIWSFFITPLADTHVKMVYVCTGGFCLAIYLLSTWKIKEGEYPPPDPHKKGGAAAPIRAYFVECFSQPYYLWIFFAMLLYQLGNAGNGYVFYYTFYDLKLTWAIQGWVGGWGTLTSTIFGLLFGFYLGSMTDRVKPIRLIAPCWMGLALFKVLWFFIVHDKTTMLICACADGVIGFLPGLAFGALQVEIFPRAKIGQFCSAQAVFYQFILIFISPLVGKFFDFGIRHQGNAHFFINPLLTIPFPQLQFHRAGHGWFSTQLEWLKVPGVQFQRVGYLWGALFYFLAGLTYIKIYSDWKKRHGHVPVPHAG